MTTSSRAGLGLVKTYEGCEKRREDGLLEAYLCPAGIWTIGWGRTTNVKKGDTCTQAQADAWLVAQYDSFEKQVRALVKVSLTDNQIGALTCFAYNVGVGAFKSSTLLKLLNAGNYQGAAEQFARWNKGGGVVLAGLTKRRAAEADLFKRK